MIKQSGRLAALGLAWLIGMAEAAPLNSEARALCAEHGPVRLCVDPDWKPFEFIDAMGRHQGMAADLWRLMSERTGIEMRLVPTRTWQESLELAQRRECDVFTLAMATPERQAYMNFTRPYLRYPFVIATRSEAPMIRSIEEVLDKPLAAVRGYAYTELLKARHPGIHFMEVDNLAEGLERVRDGRAYGMIDSLATISNAIQLQRLHELKVAGRLADHWELAIGVRNDRPEWLPIFEAAIGTLTPEDYRAAENHWLAAWVEQPADERLIRALAALAILAVLALLLVLWRHRLLGRHALQMRAAHQRIADQAARLHESEQRFEQLAEQSRTVAWEVDAEGRYTYVSPSVETVFGYRADEIVGHKFFYDLHPEPGREAFKQMGYEVLARKERLVDFENPILTKGGDIIWVNSSGLPLLDEEGKVLGFRGSDTDITARKQAEQALRAAEDNFRRLVENIQSAVFSMTPDGTFLYASPSWVAMIGYHPDEVVGTNFRRYVHPEDIPLCEATLQAAVVTGHIPPAVEYRVLHKEGGIRWHRTVIAPAKDEHTGMMTFVGNAVDVTTDYALRTELTHQATHDPLTGVANRRLFMEALERELARSRRHAPPLAVLMLDLDRFKRVNDSYGHAAGDQTLRIFVDRCRVTLRESDWLGRLGGEEFGALLPDTGTDEALAVAERLRQAIADQPFRIKDGAAIRITTSIGLALAGEDDTADSLLARADAALYAAKQAGRDRAVLISSAPGPTPPS
ncbi:MAG: diguanylate cyclase [Pseudomonadota bacterium]